MKIEGWFDPDLSPRIEITTLQGKELNLVVDTGFNGQLCLPLSLLKEIGFEYVGPTEVELADGSVVETMIYEGVILWFGGERRVATHATSSEDGLLGTQMLFGTILELDIDENKVLFKSK